ncbi:MAG: ASPIC/UnbV domain-containing protein [Verrucomicrobiota bacterium]
MSHSPPDPNPTETLTTYRDGWKVLSDLIGQGRSFSGHERNCTFLNVPGQPFANAAATTGLDFADDGRAVAMTDWDFDGNLDIWTSNRTAPRLRFLRNASGKSGSFVGIGLRGTTGNRDAIGARVEVHLRNDRPLIRTLHAGDGFLAQSSKWLHFGLGNDPTIEKITVRWPGGPSESFPGLRPDRYYLLTEGQVPSELQPVRQWPHRSNDDQPSSPEPGAQRTWVVGRVPMPDGAITRNPKPTLLNLWSERCRSCIEELEEWTERKTELDEVGLDVVILSVDHLNPESAYSNEPVISEGTFRREKASERLIEAMEIVHRAMVPLQQPLPVPTSFLLDKAGRVACIYKGRVSVNQLVKDASLLKADPADQRAAAVPFSGRWASTPFPPDPLRIAAGFSKANAPDSAIAYLKQLLAGARTYLEGQFGSQESHLQIVIDAHRMLGDLLAEEKRLPEAARVYRNLQQLAADDGSLHQQIGERLLTGNLPKEALPHLRLGLKERSADPNRIFNTGLAALGSGQADEAIRLFETALAQQPKDKSTHYQLGVALETGQRFKKAANHFRKSLALEPGWAPASRKLVVLLLKQPALAQTNTEALSVAQACCRTSKRRNAGALHLLATVLATRGRTEEALETIDEALALPGSHNATPALQRLREQLQKP